jgi:hypothetical protein
LANAKDEWSQQARGLAMNLSDRTARARAAPRRGGFPTAGKRGRP